MSEASEPKKEPEKDDAVNADADARAEDPAPHENADEPKGSVTFASTLTLFDLENKPRSRAGWILRGAVTVVGLLFLVRHVNALTTPMFKTKPPPILPTEELPGDKFRLSEEERKQIFKEFATAEIAERQRAITQNTWQGHVWSREDDRGYIERTTARASALRHHCSLSQVYLVLDEGIREKWPGPDGKPLRGDTPPFNPRTTW